MTWKSSHELPFMECLRSYRPPQKVLCLGYPSIWIFLCLQEVKISSFMFFAACHIIWQHGVMFSSQHEAGRGGVVTLLSPCLHSAIILHGSNPSHRIVWLLLSINNHSFGVINVYASNDVVERA